MLADPKPNDGVRSHLADHPIVVIDSGGVDWQRRMNSFEVKAWMVRIILEFSIRAGRLIANMRRQRSEPFAESSRCAGLHSLSGSKGSVSPASSSAMASAASFSKSPGERLNRSSQRCSESNSCSIQAPNASCSSTGSWEAFLNASCKDLVIKIPPQSHGAP